MFEALRDTFKPLVDFIATPFKIFHPNVLTVFSFFIAAPGFYFYAKGDALLGSLFILGGAFDAVDGAVARMTGKKSAFGGIWDATLDRIFDGLILLFIGIGGLVEWELLFVVYIFAGVISFIKSKAETAVSSDSVGKNQFSVGFAQRGDRLAIIFVGSILSGIFTKENHEILTGAMVVLLVLSVITFVWRAVVIYKVVEKKNN